MSVPELSPRQEPPETSRGRETKWVGDHDPQTRDMTPAAGKRGGPASWRAAQPGADVALAGEDFADSRWSYLYKTRDTRYGAPEPQPGLVAAANRRMRAAPLPDLQGPFVKGPVWTWEVPLYFWIGGVASGSGFVALACDIAGDHRSAAIARKVSLAAVTPAPLLLIADLGRPERFLNMMRIVKPRSPMNMGAWCLVAFSGSIAGAVASDTFGRPKLARGLGALTSLLGGYLGSYTGVLLACTAVPLWARSRSFLGPIFVATASATGAAATRLTLVASGLPERHPTRRALGDVEAMAILAEMALSIVNERRVGPAAEALRRGRPGRLYRAAQALVLLGLSSRSVRPPASRRVHDVASLMYMAGGLCFRFAWVQAGKASAADHEAAAALGRQRTGATPAPGGAGVAPTPAPGGAGTPSAAGSQGAGTPPAPPRGSRELSMQRRPLPLPGVRRLWSEGVRRASLVVEGLLRS